MLKAKEFVFVSDKNNIPFGVWNMYVSSWLCG